ncbi:hypothetical protein GNX71_28660 [Variovorax sp. RKNM96]|uniref:hypothetical protein n=1 Tax=Variovorax sp. RKNM96 TaxID=2681552 RepID=UPI001980BF9E|nr:hypothetical protein [Variovorax sp. RKNM96]QSI33322.1 hypothetical protein GNX71_28660 [Variovorax sp. RKNM96]
MAAQSPAVDQPRAPSPTLERRKAYCRQLCRVLVRYADEDELAELTKTLDGFTRTVLAHRECIGLNDAAYHAYTHYLLK